MFPWVLGSKPTTTPSCFTLKKCSRVFLEKVSSPFPAQDHSSKNSLLRPIDIPGNWAILKLAGVSVSAVDGERQKQLMVSEVGQW